MVLTAGIEPTLSDPQSDVLPLSLSQDKNSRSLRYCFIHKTIFEELCAGGGFRTPDILLTRQALYQLSYTGMMYHLNNLPKNRPVNFPAIRRRILF